MNSLFSNFDWWVPMTWGSLGATPIISFWAPIYFFLAVIHFFDITYFSKWLIPSGNTGKTFDERPKLQRVVKGPLVLCRSNKY